jgi:hypothetical protein
MPKIFSFLLVFLSFCVSSFAQDAYTLKGTVSDANIKEPIPHVAVYIDKTTLVTTTNTAGKFEIVISKEYQANALIFSCIGYGTFKVEITDIIQKNINDFPLKVETAQLSAVTLRKPLKPEEILKKTIEKLATNFPTEPYEQQCFYRSIAKVDGQYRNFQESILDIYNGGYNEKYDKDKYRYLNTDMYLTKQQRRGKYNLKYDMFGHIIGNTYPNMVLRSKKNLFHRAFWVTEKPKNLYIIQKENQHHAEKEVYVLEIKPKKFDTPNIRIYENEAPYKTTLYIDTDSYAIVKIEASTQEYASHYPKITDNYTFCTYHFLEANITILFLENEGKYYLHYIRGNNIYLDYGWDRNSTPKRVETQAELITENIDNRKLTTSQLYKKYGIYYQHGQVKIPLVAPKVATYNPTFWQNYTIPPFADMQKLKQDLEQSQTLEQQFIETSGKPIVSPEDEIQIKKKYNKKWQE